MPHTLPTFGVPASKHGRSFEKEFEMFYKTTLTVAAALATSLIAGGLAQAATYTPHGTDRGAILVNTSGHALKAPMAKSSVYEPAGFVNIGTDRGGVIVDRTGARYQPSALTSAPVTNPGYVNIGTDLGGVLIPGTGNR